MLLHNSTHCKNVWSAKTHAHLILCVVAFIEELQRDGLPSLELIRAIDAAYHMTAIQNAEVRMRWQTLCLMVGDEQIIPHAIAFAKEQGRMKFVRPLYKYVLDTYTTTYH